MTRPIKLAPNALLNDSVDDPNEVVLKVKISFSSDELSLSNPDPDFSLVVDVEVFHNPQPGTALTVNFGPSNLTTPRAYLLKCLNDPTKHMDFRPPVGGGPRMGIKPGAPEDIDLLRDTEFSLLEFTTIPESGHMTFIHKLSMEDMVSQSVNRALTKEDLRPGLQYQLWGEPRDRELFAMYVYFGDLAGELATKKLSFHQAYEIGADMQEKPDNPRETEGRDAAGLEGKFDLMALEQDAWVLNRGPADVRANVGRYGPVLTLVG